MKVSAVLVGVNVATTLSVAAQGQAWANDGTAAFLKDSLTALKAEPALSLSAAPKSLTSSSVPQKSIRRSSTKMSLSDPQAVATRSTLAGHGGVKLRPFNPNRKLPTRKELEVAFQAEQASYDTTPVQDPDAPLTGGVAEYASPYYVSSEYADPYISARGKRALSAQERRATSARVNKAARTATAFVRKAAPRVVPGSMPAVPGQAGFPCAQAPVQNFEPVGMNPQMAQMQMMQQQQMQQQMMEQQMAVQPPIEAPLAPPNLSPQQQAEMNRLIQAACTRANGGMQGMNFSPSLLQQNMMQQQGQQQGQGDLYQRIGPPPFPLSLIPEPALKDFVRGGKTQRSSVAATAPSGFGAWHGSGGMGTGATTTGSAISQTLPRAGFRSYSQSMSVNGFKSYSRMPSTSLAVRHHAHKGGHAHSAAHAAKHPAAASGNHGPTQIASTPQTKMYAPYESHVNFGTH